MDKVHTKARGSMPEGTSKAILGPLSMRDLIVVLGGVLVAVGSLVPIPWTATVSVNMWIFPGLPFHLFVSLLLPLLVAGGFAWRRFTGRTRVRVGSLSLDQAGSVVSLFAAAYFFNSYVASMSLAYLIGFVGALAMVAGTTLASYLGVFRRDFASGGESVLGSDVAPMPGTSAEAPVGAATGHGSPASTDSSDVEGFGASSAGPGSVHAPKAPGVPVAGKTPRSTAGATSLSAATSPAAASAPAASGTRQEPAPLTKAPAAASGSSSAAGHTGNTVDAEARDSAGAGAGATVPAPAGPGPESGAEAAPRPATDAPSAPRPSAPKTPAAEADKDTKPAGSGNGPAAATGPDAAKGPGQVPSTDAKPGPGTRNTGPAASGPETPETPTGRPDTPSTASAPQAQDAERQDTSTKTPVDATAFGTHAGSDPAPDQPKDAAPAAGAGSTKAPEAILLAPETPGQGSGDHGAAGTDAAAGDQATSAVPHVTGGIQATAALSRVELEEHRAAAERAKAEAEAESSFGARSESAPADPAPASFWFALNHSRPVFHPVNGTKLGTAEPGNWILCLEDRGSEYLISQPNGRPAVLRNLDDLQFPDN